MVKDKGKTKIKNYKSSKPQEVKKELPPKTLYRSKFNHIIGGVCSGLSEYFDIDPVIVRLIFILAVFFNGFGILLYIILWIILPEKQNRKNESNQITKAAASNSIKAKTRPVIGVILMVFGVLFFLENFGLIQFEYFWPLILIAIGIFILRR